jgi:hypothetical protein
MVKAHELREKAKGELEKTLEELKTEVRSHLPHLLACSMCYLIVVYTLVRVKTWQGVLCLFLWWVCRLFGGDNVLA